jgi:hypothetical protein
VIDDSIFYVVVFMRVAGRLEGNSHDAEHVYPLLSLFLEAVLVLEFKDSVNQICVHP